MGKDGGDERMNAYSVIETSENLFHARLRVACSGQAKSLIPKDAFDSAQRWIFKLKYDFA
jgi:hypothetical protein